MEASHKRHRPHIKVGKMRKKKNVVLYILRLILLLKEILIFTLDLGPPVPLGASGDEKPPSITVTGDPAGSMPADTHLFSF